MPALISRSSAIAVVAAFVAACRGSPAPPRPVDADSGAGAGPAEQTKPPLTPHFEVLWINSVGGMGSHVVHASVEDAAGGLIATGNFAHDAEIGGVALKRRGVYGSGFVS